MYVLFVLVGLASSVDIVSLFSDVRSAAQHRYDMKDDQGEQMACVHAYQAQNPAFFGGKDYYSVYHAQVGIEFEVRLAASNDLMTWTFLRTLLPNADMPYISQVDGMAPGSDQWLLLTHEQWMNQGSRLPSRLGFKLFYNESDLSQGRYFNSFVAPLSVGQTSQLEGTPSIYQARAVIRSGLITIDADVGFHFNSDQGVDQVAFGNLKSFGPTVLSPSFSSQRADVYDDLFIQHGAIGNIGQRKAGTIDLVHFCAQEANIGAMPPTIWADWRVWIYWFAASEGDIPAGTSGNVTLLPMKTHQGSTAFGNPSWTALNCPKTGQAANTSFGSSCIFVSYFLFSEGAKPGEAGVLAFWKALS